MGSVTLLANENEALRAADEMKQKRMKHPKRVITRGGILSVEEAEQRMGMTEQPVYTQQEVVEPVAQQVTRRKAPRCSGCGSLEHNARRCPQLA